MTLSEQAAAFRAAKGSPVARAKRLMKLSWDRMEARVKIHRENPLIGRAETDRRIGRVMDRNYLRECRLNAVIERHTAIEAAVARRELAKAGAEENAARRQAVIDREMSRPELKDIGAEMKRQDTFVAKMTRPRP